MNLLHNSTSPYFQTEVQFLFTFKKALIILKIVRIRKLILVKNKMIVGNIISGRVYSLKLRIVFFLFMNHVTQLPSHTSPLCLAIYLTENSNLEP